MTHCTKQKEALYSARAHSFD